MVIEIYGLPATGKTTLANLLVRETNCVAPPKMRGWFDVLCCSMRYILRYPAFCIHFLILTWEQTRGKTFGRRRVRLFLYKFVHRYLYILAKRAKINSLDQSNVYVLDEGWLQVALGIFERPCPEIEYLLENITPPKAIVSVDLRESAWRERMIQIGGRSRRFMGKDYTHAWTHDLCSVHSEISDVVAKSIECPIIHVDASLPPKKNLHQVVPQLQSALSADVSFHDS